MAVVSWGAPTLQFVPVTPGGSAPSSGSWDAVSGLITIPGDVLLQNSTTLNTTAGDERTIKNERGVDVDKKRLSSSYQLTTSIIKKKGYVASFPSINGVVSGNYAMRLIAEDPETPGIQMRMVNIGTSKGWSAEQGALDVLTIDGLEPDFSGDANKEICEDYSQPAMSANKSSVDLAATATAQTVTISNAVGTVTVGANASWLTPTVSGSTVTLTPTANTGPARACVVTIKDSLVSLQITVTQAAASD